VEISAELARKQKARVGAVKSHSGHFMVNCGSASDPRTWGMFLPFIVVRQIIEQQHLVFVVGQTNY